MPDTIHVSAAQIGADPARALQSLVGHAIAHSQRHGRMPVIEVVDDAPAEAHTDELWPVRIPVSGDHFYPVPPWVYECDTECDTDEEPAPARSRGVALWSLLAGEHPPSITRQPDVLVAHHRYTPERWEGTEADSLFSAAMHAAVARADAVWGSAADREQIRYHLAGHARAAVQYWSAQFEPQHWDQICAALAPDDPDGVQSALDTDLARCIDGVAECLAIHVTTTTPPAAR